MNQTKADFDKLQTFDANAQKI